MTDKISTLRLSVSRLLVIWMWANAGAAALTGYLSDNGWIAPLIMGIVLAGICHICWKVASLGKSSRLTTAVAFVAVISVMVAAARGSEMQIDLHMYYFAALAVIAASCDRDAIIMATGAVAVHHLLLNFIAPALVFPDGTDFRRVILHASILVAEAASLILMSNSINALFEDSENSVRRAELATQEAERAGREALDERSARATEQAAQARAREQEAARLQDVVDALAGGLSGLAHGKLNERLTDAFPSEYDVLRRDFNSAAQQLNDVIRDLVVQAGTVESGSAEIATAVEDMARRTERQAASLEETAATVAEVSQGLSRTLDDVVSTRDLAGKAHEMTRASSEVVNEAMTAMGRIDESSRQIAQIIGVINDIAFQTNLLALNAGVEAARAGDAGRGFAVVASEVRALAQRTSDAAKEIRELIATAETQVRSGVESVDRTGAVLASLASQVNDIDKMVRRISDTANEQASSLKMVSQAVGDMDQVTQQNAAMVEEANAAANSLLAEARHMMTLQQRFVVDDAAAPPSRYRPAAAKEMA